ncbi:hypothetical protein D3C86_2207150 [compost metagenome]
MAVGVFGHEIGHTSKANVESRINKTSGKDVEFNPEKTQGRVLKDLAKKKKQ